MTIPLSHPRDQAPSPFAEILRDLCARTGSDCAVLVDDEGEAVDYWGSDDPFQIRVFAAELAIIQAGARTRARLGFVQEIFVRARRRSFVIRALPEGYALALRLPRRAASVSERALLSAVRMLSAEAGFEGPLSCRTGPTSCRPVGVEERGARPHSVLQGDLNMGVDVLGRVRIPESRRERGFRVRLENGEEGTLVREPLGRWYLDDEP